LEGWEIDKLQKVKNDMGYKASLCTQDNERFCDVGKHFGVGIPADEPI